MIRYLVIAAFAGLLFATNVGAQQRMSQIEDAAVHLAVSRGTLIYYYDQAAWHGTDDMLAKVDRPQNIRGWIVDGPADASEIVFHDDNGEAVYVGRFSFGRLVSSHVPGPGEDRSLSPARKAMIATRAVAEKALMGSDSPACSAHPFNTVVLPPDGSGSGTLVYFLTPRTKFAAVPLGGHYLVEVDADGAAGDVRRFTKVCIELPTSASKDKPVANVVTHLLDPTPTEIHVFSALAGQIPIYVGTDNDRLWRVEVTGGRVSIALVESKTRK